MGFALGQEIINIFRGKIVDLDIMAKKKFGIEKELNNLNTLIVGSSHIQNAFIPHKGEFNLSMASQDLYYSYELIKKYDTDKIKNFVISFSVFNPGFQIIKTSQFHKCLLYKILFDIDYQFKDSAKEKHLYEREVIYRFIIKRYLKNFKADENYLGEIDKYSVSKKKSSDEYLKNYIDGNIKNNLRENEQINFVTKIIEYAAQNNKNVFWIITPHSEFYRKQIPDKKTLFKKLYEKCSNKSNVEIIDLFDDNRFFEDDFLDCDHLNRKGAEKFSEIIEQILHSHNYTLS